MSLYNLWSRPLEAARLLGLHGLLPCPHSFAIPLDLKRFNISCCYNNLYIVAGDVKYLYPSIPRSLVEKALTFAFTYHSFFTQAVIDILVNLAMFCLHNVIIQHKQNFYTQKTDIITGDNHLVSLANITLHYIILPISDVLNKSILFKRFIDDIIWLSYGVKTTLEIKNCLLKTFQDNNLDLTFRMISTADSGSTFST